MAGQFVFAVNATDVPVGTMHCTRVEGKRILIANVDGEFHAVDEMCSHEDFSLCYGALQGDRVKCSLHGSRFSLRTGKPLDEPADEPINVFPVMREGDRILVDIS